ncbi:MAG: hypothetical protein U9Q83_06095 [Bacteroidota bacterium]|nr:hypothetical protein [Bacteroidota bacterium]
MSKEANLAKIYDLIEKYKFDELNDKQKELVIANITEKEYEDMRSTIVVTESLFAKYPETTTKNKKKTFATIFLYQLELYKVAAIIILFIGFNFLYNQLTFDNKLDNKAQIDTVFVSIIDTLIIKTNDTVKVVEEKTFYRNQDVAINIDTMNNDEIYSSNYNSTTPKPNFSINDLDALEKIKTKGDISQDSALSDFVIAIN